MSESISFQKTIPIRHDVDIFVAGGGPAGVAAAVIAARQGAKVFLAESNSCLGGMGTAGLVPAFMTFDDGVNFLADGFGREVMNRLNDMKCPIMQKYKMSVPAELLKRLYDQMLIEAGVEFAFHTNVVDVVVKGSRVEYAVCSAKSGFFGVKAKMFIDGTGDGDIAVFAGAPYEKGDENGDMMPGTLCSLWGDVDYDKYDQFLIGGGSPHKQREKAVADGVFTVDDPHLPGMWRVGVHAAGGNVGHAFGVDSTDERSLTKYLVEGRERMPEFERFYREYIPGFEKLSLMATGSILGIRESRRIMGDYVLNVDDFLARANFDDEIGRYCYPVDIHPSRPSPETYAKFSADFRKRLRYDVGESYGIPYRVLLPKGLDNLLVAGRCVSCDRNIQGSIRVMPGCYITGQAAGLAAKIALELNTDIRGFEVSMLQKRLEGIGAYLRK